MRVNVQVLVNVRVDVPVHIKKGSPLEASILVHILRTMLHCDSSINRNISINININIKAYTIQSSVRRCHLYP
ncbi:hypothetical protein D1872_223340 [compost metagenome]